MNISVTGLGCIVFGLMIDKFLLFYYYFFFMWSVENESMGLCDLLLAYHVLMKMAWLWFVMWSVENESMGLVICF